MKSSKSTMKMPELLVFAKPLALGLVGAEVWRASFAVGSRFTKILSEVPSLCQVSAILAFFVLCLMYSFKRGAHLTAFRVGRSFRLDLLIAVGVGIWSNELLSPLLKTSREAVSALDPQWGGVVLLLLCAVLASPLVREWWPSKKEVVPQRYFIADEEIIDDAEDLLGTPDQAKSFAEAVLTSGAHPGLVFGLDGPWGAGKTSFINLAERHWSLATEKVIVCRFEPLRYASEPDLTDRLIRDLTAAIQQKVFAPEFRPAASRYSRLVNGKADVSFLGFKLSLEPSQETVDELLDDIDDVLRRIGRRVIIVIDDLDRLDPKTINNVLFATRRTFRLSQATYILCYDTEVLVGGHEEGGRAREFLEKFVTVKLSLFVDSSRIRDFLNGEWQHAESYLGLVPSDTIIKLGSVLTELADMLDGDLGAHYLPYVGNLRKVKRFINAMLLMQLERTDLGRTDFHKGDLIHLILLNLNYPGVFRRIYGEETEGRIGDFSARRGSNANELQNSPRFATFIDELEESAVFLLNQLFDVSTLALSRIGSIDEAVLRSRACFNDHPSRNLENYLKLIVRFATPEPQHTFVLYQEAVQLVRRGVDIASVLKTPAFDLSNGQYAHDQFWRVLVNQSHNFDQSVVDNAIYTLVSYLPYYSVMSKQDRGLRQRSIYSLVRLLDSAGWGRSSGGGKSVSDERVEIAHRIFGESRYKNEGVIQRLVISERGVLGWNDLMLFRLQCSADRQGQLHNLHSALVLHQQPTAATTGWVSELAVNGMRHISQVVFSEFEAAFITPGRNFFTEVDNVPVNMFFGNNAQLARMDEQASNDDAGEDVEAVLRFRADVKSFVIYQLSNKLPPDGAGVGCGYYDVSGAEDKAGIAEIMNEYVFDLCFNPKYGESNVLHFLDFLLAGLSSSFHSIEADVEYVPVKSELIRGFDPAAVGRYWSIHRETIRRLAQGFGNRRVSTSRYTVFYSEALDEVFKVLDDIANELNEG